MILQLSIKDDKAELFLQLMDEFKSTMVEKLDIISSDDEFFSKLELQSRVDDIREESVKPISRQEVFDGIC